MFSSSHSYSAIEQGTMLQELVLELFFLVSSLGPKTSLLTTSEQQFSDI